MFAVMLEHVALPGSPFSVFSVFVSPSCRPAAPFDLINSMAHFRKSHKSLAQNDFSNPKNGQKEEEMMENEHICG